MTAVAFPPIGPGPDAGSPSAAVPPPQVGARVGPLELANALAACALSARLTSKHRQWAAQQLVQALAASERDNPIRPQTYSDMAGDLRKCPMKKLEGHHGRVRDKDTQAQIFISSLLTSFSKRIEGDGPRGGTF